MISETKTISPVTLEERRLALLICNGTFTDIPDKNLHGPAKDAERLEAILSDAETCRFSVCTLLDRGLLEVRREIARICEEATESDTLLLYYSGIGVKNRQGELYLSVSDSDREYPHATGLDPEFILSQLRNSRCRRLILLIDGCYAGAIFSHNRGIPDGLYAITSCGTDEVCADTKEGGAFTLALCAGLRDATADRDGDGLVSIDELHVFVKQRLLRQGYAGTPQKWVWNVPEPIYMTNVPRHVFFSYARDNMVELDLLAQSLEAEGLATWIDRKGIQSGNWMERVTEGLNRARAVVVLVTPAALASDAVRKELSFAANKHITIIPVMFEDMPNKRLPDWFIFSYGDLHRHVIESARYEECVKELASAIYLIKRTAHHQEAVGEFVPTN